MSYQNLLYICRCMRERYIYKVGGIFIVLILLLIAIQMFWVNWSYTLTEKSVEQDALGVFEKAVEAYDQYYESNQLRVYQATKHLYTLSDSNNTKRPSWVEDFSDLEITESKNVMYNMLDSTAGFSNLDLDQIMQESKFKPSLQKVGLTEGYKTERTFVSDVVKRLLEVDYSMGIKQKIQPKVLDSLIGVQLVSNQLEVDYDYILYDAKQDKFLSRALTPIDPPTHNAFPFKLKLLKSDILEHHAFVYFSVRPARFSVFSSIWYLLCISFFVVLGLIYLFLSTFWAMLKQKKIAQIKSDFINNMTHELKTPIATISLAQQALEDASVAQELKKKYIDIIGKENIRLDQMVQKVLSDSMLEKGDLHMRFEPIDVHELIRLVTSEMKLIAEQSNAQITLNVKASVSRIKADRIHLQNVISNLLDNAIKYTKEAPEIEIRTYSNSTSVVLEIEDKGIGISKEDQSRVFEKLFRVHTGDIHDVKGFGLGLNYVKKILELHKATIALKSKLNEGSVFTITFPILKQNDASEN